MRRKTNRLGQLELFSVSSDDFTEFHTGTRFAKDHQVSLELKEQPKAGLSLTLGLVAVVAIAALALALHEPDVAKQIVGALLALIFLRPCRAGHTARHHQSGVSGSEK